MRYFKAKSTRTANLARGEAEARFCIRCGRACLATSCSLGSAEKQPPARKQVRVVARRVPHASVNCTESYEDKDRPGITLRVVLQQFFDLLNRHQINVVIWLELTDLYGCGPTVVGKAHLGNPVIDAAYHRRLSHRLIGQSCSRLLQRVPLLFVL